MSSPNQRVIVLVGLPGAGKSTWLARQGVEALSSDAMRLLLRGDVADQSVNSEVFALLRQLVRQRLQLGVPVTYIDATNLTRRERRQWIKIADWFGASCEAIFFDESVETCLERNQKRPRVVPEAVIWRMAGRLTPPEPPEGFAMVQVVSSSLER